MFKECEFVKHTQLIFDFLQLNNYPLSDPAKQLNMLTPL